MNVTRINLLSSITNIQHHNTTSSSSITNINTTPTGLDTYDTTTKRIFISDTRTPRSAPPAEQPRTRRLHHQARNPRDAPECHVRKFLRCTPRLPRRQPLAGRCADHAAPPIALVQLRLWRAAARRLLPCTTPQRIWFCTRSWERYTRRLC